MDVHGNTIPDWSYVKTQLSLISSNTDLTTLRFTLLQIQKASLQGMDLEEILPKILKLLSHPDLVSKKVVYCILGEYASRRPDLVLLAINTLIQDCQDANPMVRGMALKTICSLKHNTFIEYGQSEIQRCLKDSSAYVRRIAVLSCGKLHGQQPGICQELGLVNTLYNMLRDPDPIVIVNCLVTLNEILCNEGGIVINRKITFHLLNCFGNFTVWGQIYTLQVLHRFKPKLENDIFDIMNILDGYFKSNNASLIFENLKYFCYIVQDFPHLKQEVITRGLGGICNVFHCGGHELQFSTLACLEDYIDEDSFQKISKNFKEFLCKFSEPDYLKARKLQFIRHLANQENLKEILSELLLYSKDSSSYISKISLLSYGEVINKFIKIEYMDDIVKLLETDKMHVFSNTIEMISHLTVSVDINMLLKHVAKRLIDIKDDVGKTAFLNILTKYAGSIPDTPYYLEDFFTCFKSSLNDDLLLLCLTCCVKLYLEHPGSGQVVMAEIFYFCEKNPNAVVQDQVKLYYFILKNGVELAEKLFI